MKTLNTAWVIEWNIFITDLPKSMKTQKKSFNVGMSLFVRSDFGFILKRFLKLNGKLLRDLIIAKKDLIFIERLSSSSGLILPEP